MHCSRLARLALVLSLLSACNRTMPLADGARSPEALARAVLAAATANDRQALEHLALSEREFREHVWPALPAARPERNLPFSYVWGDLHQKSRLSLSNTLLRVRGKPYELRRVTFAGVTRYGAYTVHRGATFHVEDAAGVTSTVRVSGSFLEKEGVWKVFSYVVDG